MDATVNPACSAFKPGVQRLNWFSFLKYTQRAQYALLEECNPDFTKLLMKYWFIP